MNKIALTVAAFLLTQAPVYAAASSTCDQASLSKMETDIGQLSGRVQKKAKKQLDKAREAMKSGDIKKCGKHMSKIQASLTRSSGSSPNEAGSSDEDTED